jgi:hypothetical protein
MLFAAARPRFVASLAWCFGAIQEWKNRIGSPNELQVDQAGLNQFGGLRTDTLAPPLKQER